MNCQKNVKKFELSFTVGVRYKVQEGARYKVQEGVLYKVQSPFFRQIFPEGALYKVQWSNFSAVFLIRRFNEFSVFPERALYKVQWVKTACTLQRAPGIISEIPCGLQTEVKMCMSEKNTLRRHLIFTLNWVWNSGKI